MITKIIEIIFITSKAVKGEKKRKQENLTNKTEGKRVGGDYQ